MVKKLDRWCDNIWIYFIFVLGAATAVYLILNWDTLPVGAKGGAFVAIIMPFHVIEEWKLPGGLHYIYNILFGSKKNGSKYLDRYPMSRLTDMVTNTGLVVIPMLYILLSNVTDFSTEVAIAMMLFGFLEVFAHTTVGTYSLIRYRKGGKRFFYSPGFGTSYLMFLPASIYLLMNLPEGLTLMNWVGALIVLAVTAGVCVLLPETPLKKWVLKQEEGMFAFKSPKHYAKFVSKDLY